MRKLSEVMEIEIILSEVMEKANETTRISKTCWANAAAD